jgi:hypothetical protein
MFVNFLLNIENIIAKLKLSFDNKLGFTTSSFPTLDRVFKYMICGVGND